MNLKGNTTLKGTVMGVGLTILTIGVNIVVNEPGNFGGYFLVVIGFGMVMGKYYLFNYKEEE